MCGVRPQEGVPYALDFVPRPSFVHFLCGNTNSNLLAVPSLSLLSILALPPPLAGVALSRVHAHSSGCQSVRCTCVFENRTHMNTSALRQKQFVLLMHTYYSSVPRLQSRGRDLTNKLLVVFAPTTLCSAPSSLDQGWSIASALEKTPRAQKHHVASTLPPPPADSSPSLPAPHTLLSHLAPTPLSCPLCNPAPAHAEPVRCLISPSPSSLETARKRAPKAPSHRREDTCRRPRPAARRPGQRRRRRAREAARAR